jgi:hypothetical protein
MKAALDAVVLKQGVFDFVFHPHGWIKAEQVNELIDHAVEKHGKKVKFLTFREAQERIDRNLLKGHPLRRRDGGDNGVRLFDLNRDGYMDVVIADAKDPATRIWDPKGRAWKESLFPCVTPSQALHFPNGYRFGVRTEAPEVHVFAGAPVGSWRHDGEKWYLDTSLFTGVQGLRTAVDGRDQGVRFRDLDGDGTTELLVGNDLTPAIYSWKGSRWERLPFILPSPLVDHRGNDRGLRFVDLNGDGRDDLVLSNEREWSAHLWKDPAVGWEKVSGGKAGEPGAIPMIVRGETQNGAWFHSKHLWVQNEDTAKLPNLVDRRSFEDLLKPR